MILKGLLMYSAISPAACVRLYTIIFGRKVIIKRNTNKIVGLTLSNFSLKFLKE